MTVSAWKFVPLLYLLEGLPYIIINSVSVVLYAALGYDNAQITFWTGWLYLPWVLKMFWSPYLDAHGTKRRWLLGAQIGLAALFLLMAWLCCLHAANALGADSFFYTLLLGMMLGALVSATLDIATDGFYLLSLTPQQQGQFVGIRTIFYRLAMILGSGALVALAGRLAKTISVPYNWAVLFALLALLFGGGAFWLRRVLPLPQQDHPADTGKNAWAAAFKSYFSQKQIVYILLFILFYRLGDALLEKTVPLFLIKPVTEGALGLSLEAIGLIKGTFGLLAIIVGNLAGGWLLGKYGFKKCIWPFALGLTLPNIFYAYLAYTRPSITAITVLMSLEQLGYGLAMMAFSVFIMYTSQGPYKTSHYAISTGIMALGMMGPGMISGSLLQALGYGNFFLLATFLGLLALALIPLIFKIQSIQQSSRSFAAASEENT